MAKTFQHRWVRSNGLRCACECGCPPNYGTFDNDADVGEAGDDCPASLRRALSDAEQRHAAAREALSASQRAFVEATAFAQGRHAAELARLREAHDSSRSSFDSIVAERDHLEAVLHAAISGESDTRPHVPGTVWIAVGTPSYRAWQEATEAEILAQPCVVDARRQTLADVIGWLRNRATAHPSVAVILAIAIDGLEAGAPWVPSCDGTPAEFPAERNPLASPALPTKESR